HISYRPEEWSFHMRSMRTELLGIGLSPPRRKSSATCGKERALAVRILGRTSGNGPRPSQITWDEYWQLAIPGRSGAIPIRLILVKDGRSFGELHFVNELSTRWSPFNLHTISKLLARVFFPKSRYSRKPKA